MCTEQQQGIVIRISNCVRLDYGLSMILSLIELSSLSYSFWYISVAVPGDSKVHSYIEVNRLQVHLH